MKTKYMIVFLQFQYYHITPSAVHYQKIYYCIINANLKLINKKIHSF